MLERRRTLFDPNGPSSTTSADSRMKETPLENIVEKTNEILVRFLRIINEGKAESAKRYGGVLIVGKFNQDGQPVVSLNRQFGDVPEGELLNIEQWALGKVRSLHENPGCTSSWQCRNPDKDRWGGAICVDEDFLSWSSFDEHEDEALVILIALGLNLIDESRALEIMDNNSGSLDVYRRYKSQ